MIREITLNDNIKDELCLGMGFFDCLHYGHRKLIDKLKETARQKSLKTAVITFSNNPYRVFNHDSKLVYTYAERLDILQKLGIDYVLPFKFDTFFKDISKDVFLNDLFASLNIKDVICGYDYLFGNKGRGDAEYLEAYCKDKNVGFYALEPAMLDNERVSTTLIKEQLAIGNIEKVNELLTSPYIMTGTVVRGRGEGGKNNFPTANIQLSRSKMLPKHGVYKTKTYFDDKSYNSLTSIGAKPTFNDKTVTVETMIDGINEDLYGKDIKVEFYKYIRGIKKFNSATELLEQIKIDNEKSL